MPGFCHLQQQGARQGACRLIGLRPTAQVWSAPDDFGMVREHVIQLGLAVDHDGSGLVFSPLANVEVGGLGTPVSVCQGRLWHLC